MKNTIYISGVISVITIYLGGFFKIMHWPGAGTILMLSIAIYCLFFLPASILNHYKHNDGKKYWYLYVAGFLTAFINFWGMLFTIMHWPGASLLMPFGLFAPFVLFLPAFIVYAKRDSRINFSHIVFVLLIFSVIGIYDALLSLNISKDILNGSVQNEMSFRDSKKNFETKSTYYYQFIRNPSDKIVELKKETDALVLQIDSVKCAVVYYMSDYHTYKNVKEINDVSLWGVKGKDNQFAFEQMFIKNNKATRLKKSLKDYIRYLEANGFLNKELEVLVNKTIYPHDYIKPGGDMYSWEEHYRGLQAIIGLERMVNIQSNIRMIEKLILEKYLLESGLV